MRQVLVSLYVLFLAEEPGFLAIRGDVAMVLGIVWLILGVLTCRKEMSALTSALVLSYLAIGLSIASGRGSMGGVSSWQSFRAIV